VWLIKLAAHRLLSVCYYFYTVIMFCHNGTWQRSVVDALGYELTSARCKFADKCRRYSWPISIFRFSPEASCDIAAAAVRLPRTVANCYKFVSHCCMWLQFIILLIISALDSECNCVIVPKKSCITPENKKMKAY